MTGLRFKIKIILLFKLFLQEIDTTLFKENLKRHFKNKNNVEKNFILKTKINFQSTDTLSVSGQNVLKSTKAKISYELKTEPDAIINLV